MILDNYELIKEAYNITSSGKKGNSNHLKYNFYLENYLYKLKEELETQEFVPSPLKEKQICFPKRRIAQVPTVKDKVVQHLICDNYLYEALTKPLIAETCACIKHRGSNYARNLLTEQLHSFYRKHKVMPYILKLDIHSYFASINHDRLKKLIDRYVLDNDIKHIVLLFLNITEKGIPLGLQQSQLLANLNLSELDHLIKEKYRVKYYGRYMDDFYIISCDRKFLVNLKNDIEKYLNSIGLELNPKSTILYNKIEYLGFTFKLTTTGKVICKLNNKKKITQRHRLKMLAEKIHNQEQTVEYLQTSYEGWRNHALTGNTRNVVRAMDKYFNSILNEYNYQLRIISVNNREKVKIICQEQ